MEKDIEKKNLNTSHATIRIKNMVSNSCIRLVKQELENSGYIDVRNIKLGVAEIEFNRQKLDLVSINNILKQTGFEIITDHAAILIEQIKATVIERVYGGNKNDLHLSYPDYLSKKLRLPYFHISKIFSERTGITVEKYIILVKTERIKELISYDDVPLSEIAFQLGYSSVQYLSNQFKEVTGYTITRYKKNPAEWRKSISCIPA